MPPVLERAPPCAERPGRHSEAAMNSRTSPEIRSSSAAAPTEWAISTTPVPYEAAVNAMEARVEAIAQGEAGELVWLVEHPPIYTAGVSAKPADLLTPARFPVFKTGRGGEFTYHGPGQRVAYVMLDLRRRGRDVRVFVASLEDWLIHALLLLNVVGERRCGRIGVWVTRLVEGSPREEKIAAIGVKLRRWVSFHGISLNVDPDLDHFAGIVPCGLTDYGVTSLAQLGVPITMAQADQALKEAFVRVLGPAQDAPAPLSS